MSFFYTNVQSIRNKIYVKGYDSKTNESIITRVDFKPTVYIPTKDESFGWKSIYGDSLQPVKMQSIPAMRDYIDGIEGICGLTTSAEQKYTFINESCPGEVEYKRNLIKILTFDIEIESEGGFPDVWNNPFQKVNAITANMADLGYITWGLLKSYQVKSEDHEYRRFDSEEELLTDFFKFIHHEKPDVISGWNIEGFDIPYLINRAKFIGQEDIVKYLSPWKLKEELNTDRNGQSYYRIPGLGILDYMALYKKFCLSPRESYSLNHICHVELGEEKLDYSEYENLENLYKKNWEMFIDYNKRDTFLILKLDDKLKYFDLAITYAYLAKVNYEDIFGTVKYWDVKIYNALYDQKIAVPSYPKGNNKEEYPGGYVKDPQVGMHKWVSTFDLNSLYPNLMVQFNMSPETIINWYEPNSRDNVNAILNKTFVSSDEYSVTANGYYFSKEKQGIIPAIVENLYELRKEYKNKMIAAEKELQMNPSQDLREKIGQYNAMQHALKISLNSLYGAIGNAHFRYFDVRIAEAITLSGQTIVKWTEKRVNEYMSQLLGENKDFVIGIDTDSVFVCMEDLIDKYVKDQTDTRKVISIMDRISEDKILPVMSAGFDELCTYLNCYKSRMVIKRESLANIGIWVAKKKYVMNVYNNEGVEYKEPKMKIKGLEIVRTSTPEMCRASIKEAVNIIFNEGETAVQNHIKQFKEKFINSSAHEVAFPRGMKEMDKWIDSKGYIKPGIPIHVRSAYNYNKTLEKLNLTEKYNKITDGEKIKFMYLKVPNPIHSNVIAFQSLLPKEFNLEEYIDYDKQFEKAFVAPILIILNAIGWEIETKTNLMSLFE